MTRIVMLDAWRTYSSFPEYCAACGIRYDIHLISLNLIIRLGVLEAVFGQGVALGVTRVINFRLQNFWVFRSARASLQNRSS
jgi:hypothetical protein